MRLWVNARSFYVFNEHFFAVFTSVSYLWTEVEYYDYIIFTLFRLTQLL
jgi:hypothetical protein